VEDSFSRFIKQIKELLLSSKYSKICQWKSIKWLTLRKKELVPSQISLETKWDLPDLSQKTTTTSRRSIPRHQIWVTLYKSPSNSLLTTCLSANSKKKLIINAWDKEWMTKQLIAWPENAHFVMVCIFQFSNLLDCSSDQISFDLWVTWMFPNWCPINNYFLSSCGEQARSWLFWRHLGINIQFN